MRPRAFFIPLFLLVLSSPGFRARAILGGSDAAEGEFPWIAGIVRRDVPAPGLIGGGSLVGDQWVITAAHSVDGLQASDLEVWLGITDLNDTASRLSAKVLAIHIHPDFVSENGTSVNDLALLLLDRRVSSILPIPLVEDEGDLGEGAPVQTAGWGTTMNGMNEPSQLLQRADAEIVSQMSATSVFGGVINSTHLPAKDPA
ncbi:MAG: trypsin-like serine protease, partial [Verrucomicrobiae bacterium]|nr:trypsin-like serine protease [Verrucomicrobiae bacterium]